MVCRWSRRSWETRRSLWLAVFLSADYRKMCRSWKSSWSGVSCAVQSQLMTSYVIDSRACTDKWSMTRKTRASRWLLSFFAHSIALHSGFGHDLEIMEELISAEHVLLGVEIIVKVILINDLLELCWEPFPRHRLVCIRRGRVIRVFGLATAPKHGEVEISARWERNLA